MAINHWKTAACRSVLLRLSRDDGGSEQVEFALAVSLWVGAAFLLMYASLAVYAAHFVANAAQEAARYGSVRGSSWSGTSCSSAFANCVASGDDISAFVKQSVPPGLSFSNLSIATSWPGTTFSGSACDTADGNNSPDCIIKVTVNYRFSFPVPFFSQSVLPISSTSQMTIVR